MDAAHPLAVVTPTLDADVLAHLARVEFAFTPGQLRAAIGRGSVSGIRKVLSRLAAQGVVEARRISSVAITYSLNRDHLAADAIIALAHQQDALFDRLRATLERWSTTPRYACVFGSWARGRATVESDLDLFLVRPDDADLPTWDRDNSQLEHAATRWTGNDARVLVLTEEQVRTYPQDPVLADIVDEGRAIMGDQEWLHRIVRGRIQP